MVVVCTKIRTHAYLYYFVGGKEGREGGEGGSAAREGGWAFYIWERSGRSKKKKGGGAPST